MARRDRRVRVSAPRASRLNPPTKKKRPPTAVRAEGEETVERKRSFFSFFSFFPGEDDAEGVASFVLGVAGSNARQPDPIRRGAAPSGGRARRTRLGRKRRREPARGKGFRLSVPSSSARARRVARIDDDAIDRGRRFRDVDEGGGVRGTRGVPVVHIPIGSSLSSHRRESRFARARVVSLLARYLPRRRNPSARSRGPPPRARLPYPFTRR